MPNINTNAAYQQILSLALEDRSSGYQDLVSNNNALLAVMKRKGLWQTYSGPRIRQTLQIGKNSAQWYAGYDQLLNPALDIFNDCYFDPKMVVVPVILSMQEILNNEGQSQLEDVYDAYIDAAERALSDTMDAGSTRRHRERRQADHRPWMLQYPSPPRLACTAVSTVPLPRSGGQARSTRTLLAGSTQVNSTTIRPMLNYIMTNRSRGKDYADLLMMSPEHYAAYDAATVAIQRQQNETSLGKLGFSALEYIGGGKRAEIVLDGGIGSNMTANTTFGINTDTLRLRYHPSRNFDKLFDGDGQMPIDKDAIAQFIGWMGELTMTNPLFNWRAYDSNPAA
jgi:hypothetical protein